MLNQWGGKAKLIRLIFEKINNDEISAPDVPSEKAVKHWIKTVSGKYEINKLILGKSTSCLLNSRPHGRLYFCLLSNQTERKAKAYE